MQHNNFVHPLCQNSIWNFLVPLYFVHKKRGLKLKLKLKLTETLTIWDSNYEIYFVVLAEFSFFPITFWWMASIWRKEPRDQPPNQNILLSSPLQWCHFHLNPFPRKWFTDTPPPEINDLPFQIIFRKRHGKDLTKFYFWQPSTILVQVKPRLIVKKLNCLGLHQYDALPPNSIIAKRSCVVACVMACDRVYQDYFNPFMYNVWPFSITQRVNYTFRKLTFSWSLSSNMSVKGTWIG